ncbi:uncharacterized protein [Miscanthus floridulus]|uniref:uncharacterized protein n=1 Tax=Miscanthus floridulus TaxID=154761 RepID=UPI003459B29D
MLRRPNTRGAWTYLEHEFLSQRESHALLLFAAFRTAMQGASMITDFCRRLETMAATLTEFGDPIGDRTLVLMLFHGLSGKFRPTVSNLKMCQPFPTIEEARTLLLLKEINLDDITAESNAPPVAPSAFVAAPNATPRTSTGGGHSGGTYTGQGSQPSQRFGHRHGKGGKQQQQQNGSNTGGPRPPVPFSDPWAGTVQFWLHPYGAQGCISGLH